MIDYVRECVKVGYEIDWERFCHDVGFTRKAAVGVREAVQRAGSTEFLKPIKEHAPDYVSSFPPALLYTKAKNLLRIVYCIRLCFQ